MEPNYIFLIFIFNFTILRHNLHFLYLENQNILWLKRFELRISINLKLIWLITENNLSE